MVSGYWEGIYNFMFVRPESAQIWINVLIIGVIVGAIIAVLKDAGGSLSGSSGESAP